MEQNPQNNLKIFQHQQSGTTIQWDVKDEKQQYLLQTAISTASSSLSLHALLTALFLTTSFQQLLSLIRTLQSEYDEYDIEYIYPLYQSLLPLTEDELWEWKNETVNAETENFNHSSSTSSTVYSLTPSSIDFSTPATSEVPFCRHCHPSSLPSYSSDSSPPQLDALSRAQRLSLLRNFLISVTLKDLSCMLTIQPSNQTGSSTTAAPSFFVSIRAIDFDQKSISKLQHYYDLDHEIATNYHLSVDHLEITAG